MLKTKHEDNYMVSLMLVLISPFEILSLSLSLSPAPPLFFLSLDPSLSQVFNLSERSYDISRFNNQVLDFGWPDHLAPSLERLSRYSLHPTSCTCMSTPHICTPAIQDHA